MILVISKKTDYSTDDVLRWLNFYKVNWIRINGEDFDENNNEFLIRIGANEENCLIIDGKPICPNLIKGGWFRRYHDFSNINSLLLNERLKAKVLYKLNKFLKNEIKCLFRFFMNSFSCPWLDSPENINLNKLMVLSKAQELGLKIPETLITNRLDRINEIQTDDNGKYITKPIYEVESFEIGSELFMLYTKSMSEIEKGSSQHFFPVLIQEKIQKKYEIRTFYLKGKCYSMAIFSQNDKQTKVDFRNYNHSQPNRNVPYKLPVEIEFKLSKLMEFHELSHGSIDLIKGLDGYHYFLEVNPVGQFGMVSYPCNYSLEKEIAKSLKDYVEN